MLKLICGLVCVCVCVCPYMYALLFDSRLWTLKDKAISLPPDFLLTQSFSFSSSSAFPLFLAHLSDLLLLTNERGEDDTYFHKMDDPSFESEEGRDEGKNTNTFRPLIAFFPPKKVKLTFRCSVDVLCVLVLFCVCVCICVFVVSQSGDSNETLRSRCSVTAGQTPALRCADHTFSSTD